MNRWMSDYSNEWPNTRGNGSTRTSPVVSDNECESLSAVRCDCHIEVVETIAIAIIIRPRFDLVGLDDDTGRAHIHLGVGGTGAGDWKQKAEKNEERIRGSFHLRHLQDPTRNSTLGQF